MVREQAMRVLVVDDEEAMRAVLEMRLQEWGFEVSLAASGAEAREKVERVAPDVVISDVVLPDTSGLDLLHTLQRGDLRRPVLLITAHGTVELAVDAMKGGAREFLTKPLDITKLRATLETFRGEIENRRQTRRLAGELDESSNRFGAFVGQSKVMREAYRMIADVAATQAPVLITGESGTGKEVGARAIHSRSSRSEGPFVAINAAALPKELMESEIFGHEKGAFTGATGVRQGCFELADGGTLFLDEIAEMPIELQPKLLRVLEDSRVRRLGGSREYQFDVRLLAATNQEPRRAIEEGRLREDLYYRLNVFTLSLAPLRERSGDLPLLCQHFVGLFNEKHRMAVEGLDEETLDLLEAYPWPGNVRELRNVMERSVVLAKEGLIETRHLPPYIRRPDSAAGAKISLPLGTTMAEAEKELILKTLEQVGNNKAEAARRLGLDVKTIRNKLKTFEPPDPIA